MQRVWHKVHLRAALNTYYCCENTNEKKIILNSYQITLSICHKNKQVFFFVFVLFEWEKLCDNNVSNHYELLLNIKFHFIAKLYNSIYCHY